MLRHRQRGLTLISTLVVGIVLAALLLLGLKLVPVYTEYFGIKGALNKVAGNVGANPTANEIRRAFDKFAEIDDITSVSGQDIEILKEAGGFTLSVAYRREVPLFANASLVLDFEIESAKGGGS